jgi:hypothetical protein
VSFISFVTLGTNKVLSLVVSNHIESINSNRGVSFHSILVTITQLEIHFKTKVCHKHMVVIYHRNTPLPKVRKGLDRYSLLWEVALSRKRGLISSLPSEQLSHFWTRVCYICRRHRNWSSVVYPSCPLPTSPFRDYEMGRIFFLEKYSEGVNLLESPVQQTY